MCESFSSLRTWAVLAAAAAAACSAADRPQINWHRSFEQTAADGRTLDRPMLLYFTAKWCPSCLRVERTALVDKRIVAFVNEQLVALRVDADASPELVETWRIDKLPTALIVTSDGQVCGRIEGYRSAESYLSELKSLVQNTAPEKSQSQIQPTSHATPAGQIDPPNRKLGNDRAAPAKPQPIAGPAVRISLKLEPNLMLDGACVVTMLDEKSTIVGDPEYSTEFNGATYWFAGPAELERFRANPQRYEPALGGHCVPSFIDDGLEVVGSMQCAATFRDRLYLFAGPELRRRFQANPTRYCDAAAKRQ